MNQVHLLPLSDIKVSERRQRKEFSPGSIMELLDSISKPGIGLMHPIVIRDGNTLVAGERRLRAFRDAEELGTIMFFAGRPLPIGVIPAVHIGTLDPLDAWEAELEENIRRVDLSWQESAKATAELLEMRRAKAERDGAPAPTIADIIPDVRPNVGDFRGAYGDVRNETIVAPYLNDPDVAAAPNLEKALKVIKRKEESKRNSELATSLGKTMTGSSHKLFNEDAAEWVGKCPASTFSVILTDPPYGMGADTFGDRGGRTEGEHGYEDSPEVFHRILSWLPEESFRVATPEAHLYLFCDIDWFAELKARFSDAGWKVFRTPLIWHKPSGFLTPWVEMGPQRRYETCLYAMKGNRKVQKITGDVISVSSDENLGHAAQKPVELYKELLSRSALPGENVLDLFCGTGPIFPAAHALKCKATGIEIDPASYGIAAKRIQELS